MAASNVESTIRREFKQLLREDIDCDIDNTPIVELGIDSLDFFELLTEIEDKFGQQVPLEELDDKVTLLDLINSIG